MAHSVLYKFGAPDSLRVHHSLGTRATIQRDENCACARIRDISSCTASCKSGRQNLSGRNKKWNSPKILRELQYQISWSAGFSDRWVLSLKSPRIWHRADRICSNESFSSYTTGILVNTAVRNYNEDSCVVTYMYGDRERDTAILLQNHMWGTRWHSRLRHYATNRKVAGSIPDGVTRIFYWHNPSRRTIAPVSTQPLTEMSTRNISWG